MAAPDLSALLQEMRRLGATRLYLKRLSPNDNSKNQIYLGRDFSSLHVIPHGEIVRDSARKAGSKRERMKAAVKFAWIGASARVVPARDAQLILYPRYPEVRLSGLLRGCRNAPGVVLRSRQAGRLFFIGTGETGSVLAWSCGPEALVARQLHRLGRLPTVGVFEDLSARLRGHKTAPRTVLLAELRRVHRRGWIGSKRLYPEGSVKPYSAQNGGGYTLEAELGVRPNGRSAPDFLGWEVKQFRVASFDKLNSSTLTLMTPEPDGGLYVKSRVEFIRTFGYPDRRGRPGRTNFGGRYYVGRRVALTGLTLRVEGFDYTGKRFSVAGGIGLVTDDGLVAASWSHAKLAEHWNCKHAQAAYVPCMQRKGPPPEYEYGPRVLLGTGTDYVLFLRAVADGVVFLDPALKLVEVVSQTSRQKLRNQFRIRSGDLRILYSSMEEVRL